MTFLTGAAFAAFLSASTADAVTTHRALARGGVETNPVLTTQAVMVGVKAGSGALMGVAAARWEHDHPRATRVLLLAGAGLYSGLAWHNSRVAR